jgi:PAS domain S-box-containing protein
MVVTDSDGRIVLVNSRAENLFGYKREELKGQPVEMLVPEELRERHLELRKDFYKSPKVRVVGREQDLYARRKDGTQFPVEIGLNPIETEEGICVLSSIMDMTEKRRAEDERQKFVSLADQSLEFIGMYDLDFKPFYVNSAGLHLVGVDNLETARRATFQDHFFPEDQSFIVHEFLPRLQREGYGKVQIRFRHFKTGEPVWVLYNMFAIYDSRGVHVGWGTVSADITERKRAEEALRESRQELRALAGRLINAEEQERKRISRELHDDLSQKLALLAFDAGGLLVTPPPSADKVHEQLFRLRGRVVELAQDVRQISHQLHPSILEDLGLSAALRELCEEFSAREGIEVLFTQEGTPAGLPMEVASCLYRVTQEALHNVRKHARTGYVRVKVDSSANGIHLVVRDTGVGFDAEASLRRPGLGIVSMKERVRMVQGEFSIYSRPGQGTEVRVFVPVSKGAS